MTAGLTWPPEMLELTETAAKSAKALATAAATRPAGVVAAEPVNLAASSFSKMKKIRKNNTSQKTNNSPISFTHRRLRGSPARRRRRSEKRRTQPRRPGSHPDARLPLSCLSLFSGPAYCSSSSSSSSFFFVFFLREVEGSSVYL